MKLQPVFGVPFTATCKACGERKLFGGSQEPLPFGGFAHGYADLEGKAFEDYYCDGCTDVTVHGIRLKEAHLTNVEVITGASYRVNRAKHIGYTTGEAILQRVSEYLNKGAQRYEDDNFTRLSSTHWVFFKDPSDYSRYLWELACEADGVEPSAKFVAFSKGNKAHEALCNFSRAWQQANKEAYDYPLGLLIYRSTINRYQYGVATTCPAYGAVVARI